MSEPPSPTPPPEPAADLQPGPTVAAGGRGAPAPAPPQGSARGGQAAAALAVSAFDRDWKRWLHDGVMPNTAFAPKTVAVRTDSLAAAPSPGTKGLDVVFLPDPSVHDGRYANNAWLQELPKSLTKLTWDNAALIAPATAALEVIQILRFGIGASLGTLAF